VKRRTSIQFPVSVQARFNEDLNESASRERINWCDLLTLPYPWGIRVSIAGVGCFSSAWTRDARNSLLEVLTHFQVLPHRDPRTRRVTREDSVIQCSMTLVLPHSHIGHRRFNAHELDSPRVIQNEGSRQPATTSDKRLWILQMPTRTNVEKKD